MPQKIRASWQRAFACRGLFVAVAAAGLSCLPPAILYAQSGPLRGYITAVHLPDAFDVDSQHVTMTTDNTEPILVEPSTSYQWIGSDANSRPAASDDVKPGIYVEVTGTRGEHGLEAATVTLREAPPKSIKGFGLIVRVIAAGPGPVFEADGYRIHVPAGATTKFAGKPKTLADAGPNTWLKYEAKRETSGDLVALTAEFSRGKTGKKKPPQIERDAAVQDAIPAHATLIDSNGNFKTGRTKIRLSDAGGTCGWHRLVDDPALQARVWRVGMSVVPAYQRQLAKDDATKIHFRFYVVDESQIRSEFGCASGLILVPKVAIDRLKNDAQLAAILADGVAFNLMVQSPRWLEQNAGLLGAVIGGDVAAPFSSWSGLITEAAVIAVTYKIDRDFEEQRGRIDLGLMADAGYDPWQAPEAWRLLTPKKLPAATSHLKYPNEAGYQLAILHLQYAHDSSAKPDTNGTTADLHQTK